MSEARESGEYVVVARRYRPRQFDELLGQEHVAKALRGAIESHRVGHAYLFTGARGVGKTSAARILAKALNCVHGPSVTPCNECDSCQAIAAGEDIDVLEIDGASNRGIDEIRQLRQNVNIRPSRSRFKIYIIDEVHMLTREAFNALLKTLEEPPEHVKFIFCTTEAEKVPVTVLSRCQRFDFAGIQTNAIAARLKQIVEAEGVAADDAALELLARRAGGSMRDSQSLLEQLLSLGESRLNVDSVHQLLGTASSARLAEMVRFIVSQDPAGALAVLDAAAVEGVDVGQLTDQLLGYLRDLMVASVGGKEDAFLSAAPSDAAWLIPAARELGVETILAMMQILDHTLERMRVSVHRRTLLELALVRLCSLGGLRELASVIEGLRKGIAPAAAPAKKNIEPPRVTPPTVPAAAPVQQTPVPVAPVQETPAPLAAAPQDSPAIDRPQAEQQQPVAQESAPPANASEESEASPGLPAAELWETAMANVENLVAMHAASASSVEYGGPSRLVVEFSAEYSFQKSMCERPEQARKIGAAIEQVAGRPLTVEYRLGEPSAAAANAGAKGRQTVRRPPRASIRDYVDNNLVKDVAEVFSASPLKVDPPPGG